MAQCEQKVKKTNHGNWTVPVHTERCGKVAVIQDTHGRNLCQKHYNKWLNKLNKLKAIA